MTDGRTVRVAHSRIPGQSRGIDIICSIETVPERSMPFLSADSRTWGTARPTGLSGFWGGICSDHPAGT
jgi:hypothetical protein